MDMTTGLLGFHVCGIEREDMFPHDKCLHGRALEWKTSPFVQ